MGDLAAFLLARIDDDEWLARQAASSAAATREIADSAVTLHSARRAYVHFNRWGPDRVLAECEAKRRIVEAARDYSPELEHGDNGEWAFDLTLRRLALPYADHPDFPIRDGDE